MTMNSAKLELPQLENLVVRTLKDILETVENETTEPINGNTVIFGRGGLLDSIGLVTLITDLEETIEEETGASVTLADERAMSQERSPFKNISLLAEYINTLIQSEK